MDEDRRAAPLTPEGHLPPDDRESPFGADSPDAVDSIAPIAPSPSAAGADAIDAPPEVEPAPTNAERNAVRPVDPANAPPE